MNLKRKLLIFIISFIILPINTLAYTKYLIPGGENVGITIHSNGVYVVGFYKVNGVNIAEKAGFKIGDKIVKINDKEVLNVSDLINNINGVRDNITLDISFIRDDKLKRATLLLSKEKDGSYKTGLYVKDTITGIGTLTFINPDTLTYGALGHEVIDNTTKNNFNIKDGKVFKANVTSIIKGNIGVTGEKNASLEVNKVYGDIKNNLKTGIYGTWKKSINKEETLEVASIDEVEMGKAEIITVLNDNKKEKFAIEILSIDKNSDTKNFLIKATDENLIKKTGGIIKGMSGSPIIQNGKIIGAVTHTIVDKPNKGYGISIIKMLESIGE